MPLNTPVAFIIFNRPDTTQRVFAEIARARPRKLLVIADGPRTPEEAGRCQQAREIIQQVDWECEVLTNFSDVNMGCKRRVSSGLDWVFEQCEEAIILEDDCLPHPTFFRFCEELLAKYRDDERVMVVSGNNFQEEDVTSDSYYFSRYNHIWGWASWRRAWQHYDVAIADWPTLRQNNRLFGSNEDAAFVKYWQQFFEAVYQKDFDTWDAQWTLACWTQNGLSVLPCVNLVSNIGFGEAATHTKNSASAVACASTRAITFPLKHPRHMIRSQDADDLTFAHIFAQPPPSRKQRVLGLLHQLDVFHCGRLVKQCLRLTHHAKSGV